MSVLYDPKRKTYYCKYTYKDYTGATRWSTKRGFARKKDASAFEASIKSTRSGEPPVVRVNELCDAYIDDLEARGCSYNYRRYTLRHIRDHIKPQLGELNIKDVTPNTIRQWQKNLPEQWKASTKNLVRTTLSIIFRFAVSFYGLPRNPVQSVRGYKCTETKKYTVWTPDEFNAFIEQLPDVPLLKLIYQIMFFGGLRISEAKSLCPHNFDFASNQISVTHSFNRELKVNEKTKTPTSVRHISMPPALMQTAQALLQSLPLEPDDRIWSKGYDYATIAAKLKKAAQRANLPQITPHDLRHSHASMLIRNGVPVTDIARRLGHKTPATTLDTYSHFYESGDAEIAKKLSVLGGFESRVQLKGKKGRRIFVRRPRRN